MRLIPLRDVRHESGHCFVAELDGSRYPGEDTHGHRKSGVVLFENGHQLGPASAPHDVVRKSGRGAYSHWGSQIYFSASDNSPPPANGRSYLCMVPDDLAAEAASAHLLAVEKGHLAGFFNAVARRSICTQGAELHTAYTLRTLLHYCALGATTIEGASCLEIGASPSSGLALALGLLGAKRVTVNNVTSIKEVLDSAFVETITLLTSLISPLRREPGEVLVTCGEQAGFRLSSEYFTVLGNTDAVDLPDAVGPFDLVFSFSVLEHIRHLPAVLRRLRKLTQIGSTAIHAVDARDHTNFADPLAYLRLDRQTFQERYGQEHNRWRLSEYRRMFVDAGWRIDQELRFKPLPVGEDGSTDMMSAALLGPERMLQSAPRAPAHAMGNTTRIHLAPEYQSISQEDLEALVFTLLARPR